MMYFHLDVAKVKTAVYYGYIRELDYFVSSDTRSGVKAEARSLIEEAEGFKGFELIVV